MIKESEERLQEFVRCHIQVRQGFTEFVADCEADGSKIVIVSSGLDFYIETVLGELDMLDVELYCGKTKFTESGIVASYTDHMGKEIGHGFKERYLNWLKQREKTIVYIGDGLSDLDAARNASYVFATGHLASLLTEGHISSWSSFNDFLDIKDKLPLLKS